MAPRAALVRQPRHGVEIPSHPSPPRPMVAVTCDRRAGGPAPSDAPRVRPKRPEVYVGQAVVDQLRRAGCEPVLIPPHEGDPTPLITSILSWSAGVVITGGAFDIHPSHYGETVDGRIDRVDEGRTGLELALARACLSATTPTLGICGGMQALAVAGGGTLVQDIATAMPEALEHEQPTDPAAGWHPVRLSPGLTRRAANRDTISVNSTHHQAVRNPGVLVVTGLAPDGVVEVVEHPSHPWCVGVQWHPEYLHDWLFDAFVKATLQGGHP